MTQRVIAFFLAPALLWSAAAAADETVPDAAAIRAKVKAADPVPHEYRETTVTQVFNGTTDTSRSIVRGDDWRSITDAGPFHDEAGKFKGQAWHQNDNGQTVLDEPDPGIAKPDPTTETVIRVQTPFPAYVIAKLNARGWGSRRFVDLQTWRVMRSEYVTGNGTIVTTFDDFRLDGGRTFAHHWLTVDDYARVKREGRITAYDPSPVTDAEVGMPNSRRLLVEFPAGVATGELPARFGRNHVFVRVTINGRGLDFMLDTGSYGITIDNGVAHQLGLTAYAPHSAVTAQRYGTARTIVPEMKIGKLVMRDVAIQIVPDGMQEGDVKTVGLLGFDFLAELGVTIDYENQKVTVVPEPAYQPPSDPHTIPLNVRIGRGSPYLDVRINGALSERFLIDTGGAGTFMIFDAFARKHPEALKDKGGGGDARLLQFQGIGGNFPTKPYQLGSVKMGPLNFVDFVGYLVVDSRSYAGNTDGLIGADFLHLFTVGLDYANSRIYLVPNSIGRRAMGLAK